MAWHAHAVLILARWEKLTYESDQSLLKVHLNLESNYLSGKLLIPCLYYGISSASSVSNSGLMEITIVSTSSISTSSLTSWYHLRVDAVQPSVPVKRLVIVDLPKFFCRCLRGILLAKVLDIALSLFRNILNIFPITTVIWFLPWITTNFR